MQLMTIDKHTESRGTAFANEAACAPAALMLSIIDSACGEASRRERLAQLTRSWWTTPGRYHKFLHAVLASNAFAEDAKLRLLTMGRPGPQDTGSFVVNCPVLAAEMFMAVADAHALPVLRERRFQSLGFSADDVTAGLMREPRRVREPLIAGVETRRACLEEALHS